MQVKYDIKPWKDIQRLLNGDDVNGLRALLASTGQPSLPGKSFIAAHMLAQMKAKNVK